MPRSQGLARAGGLSLVELIAALVILGVLAGVALPRFQNLGQAAQRSAVASTAGAFRSALVLANTGCMLRGWAGRDNLPTLGDGTVDFNTACFPTDTSGNANTIGNNATRCQRVWNGILALAPSITTAAGGADYRARANNQVCTYQYLKDTSSTRQFTYDSRNGLVVLTNP